MTNYFGRDHYFCTDRYVGVPVLSDYDGEYNEHATSPTNLY